MTHILDTPQEILKKLQENGYWFARNVNFTRKEYVEFCESICPSWTPEIHELHGESFDEDEIVMWSNRTRFGDMSLPWHADNPWHEKYKFPLRVLYAVTPQEQDEIHFLNTTKWFEDQSIEFKDYLRSLKVLTQDYKGKCQPYWSSFIKKHPVTGKENFNWGAMRVGGRNVHGLQHPEGWPAPRFSYTMAIEKPNRDLVLDDEICDWFESMMDDRYLYTHTYQKGDVLITDNWVSLHYRGPTKGNTERLLWRKTLLQPWQTL